MATTWKISSIERMPSSPPGRDAYRVSVAFTLSSGLVVENAAGIYIEVPTGGTAADFEAALAAHGQREELANAPGRAVPADIAALVPVEHTVVGI